MLNLDMYPVPVPGVVGRILEPDSSGDREAVLVLPEQSQVKVLNEVGARIWSLIDGRRNLREIALLLSGEYSVDPEQAQSDVLEFTAQLSERRAVTLQDHPVGAG